MCLSAHFFFAVHILVIDYFTQYVDGVKMSCIQFFACGAVSGAAMLLFEEPSVSALLSAWQPVLYDGGSFVQWSRLYSADHRTEGNESYGGFPDSESGISGFGAGGTSPAGRDLKRPGSAWLRADVGSYRTGAAAAEAERNRILRIGRKHIRRETASCAQAGRADWRPFEC